MKNFTTIIQSIVTEKASMNQSKGRYTFMVKRDATKIDIKNAIRSIFGAEVDSVRVMVSPKKIRILKGRYEWAKRPVFKKAIVKLKNNLTIDPNKVSPAKDKKDKAEKAKTKKK